MKSIMPSASSSPQARRAFGASRLPGFAVVPRWVAENSRLPFTFSSVRGVPRPESTPFRATMTSSKPSPLMSQAFRPRPSLGTSGASSTSPPSNTPPVLRNRRVIEPSWWMRSKSPSRSTSISLRPSSASTGRLAAPLPSLKRAVAVVEQQPRAEQQVDVAVLVEVHGLAAARHVGVAGRVGLDARGGSRVREAAIAVVQEQPVARAVTPVLVIRREHVHVAVVVEVRGEQGAAESAHGERRDGGRSHVLAVALVDVQEGDRVGVSGRRRHVAEDLVEAVAVEVREAHVTDLARIRGQVFEAHFVEFPRHEAAGADARVDAAERRRQVEAVVVVHEAERGAGDAFRAQVVLADDPGRRHGHRAADADPRVVHGEHAVVERPWSPGCPRECRASRRPSTNGAMRPAAGELRFDGREVDAVMGRPLRRREIDGVPRVLGWSRPSIRSSPAPDPESRSRHGSPGRARRSSPPRSCSGTCVKFSSPSCV